MNMVTVQMTEAEYKAYQLYLKSVEMMKSAKKNHLSSLEVYLSNPGNKKAIEQGIAEMEDGKTITIDPADIWANIK